jgi:hypothetical protein
VSTILRRLAAPTVISITALATVACGSGNNGTLPTPTTTSTSDAPSSTSGTASDRWFTTVKSCDLPDQSTLTRLGLTSPGSPIENSNFENSCEWKSDQGDLQLVLTPQTYDSLPANMGQLSKINIVGRPGMEDQNSGGNPTSCDIDIEATLGSRALAIVTTLTTLQQACNIANEIIQAVAPKLPSLSG